LPRHATPAPLHDARPILGGQARPAAVLTSRQTRALLHPADNLRQPTGWEQWRDAPSGDGRAGGWAIGVRRFRFPPELITVAVRYPRYGLSYRDVDKELLAEPASRSTTSRSTAECSGSRRCSPPPPDRPGTHKAPADP